MSRSREELQALLEDAGARTVAPPRPEFVDELGARLLADAPTSVTSARTRRAPRSRARLVRPALVAAAAAVAAAVLVGALAGWFGQDQAQRRLQLAAAVDTVVVLPDGTEVEGTDGLELPDGSVVRTGPDGHAEVGDVELGPDEEAVVEDGRIEISVPDLPLPTPPEVTVPTLLP